MEGVGAHQFWGFSPPLDLVDLVAAVDAKRNSNALGLPEAELAERKTAAAGRARRPHRAHAHGTRSLEGAEITSGIDREGYGPDEGELGEPLRALVVRAGDVRHVLKTVAQRRRLRRRPIHIYLYETPNEALARDLLLLQLVHDWELPIRHRANTFAEVFANARVQERTAELISNKRHDLIHLVCDATGAMANLVDCGLLKHKDRDELEEIFKAYDSRVPYDVVTLRDQRLRHLYGERYDFRANLVDWDYQSTVKPRAGGIHYKHFRQWRLEGTGVEFGDQTYNLPNRSLASYAEGRERGRTTLRRGFWADVVNSPYHAMGTAAYCANRKADELFQVVNKGTGTEQWRHTGVDITVYNLLSWLHEIETGEVYEMSTSHEIYSGLGDFDRAADRTIDEAERDAAQRRKAQQANDDAPAPKAVDGEPAEATAEAASGGAEEHKSGDAGDAAGEAAGEAAGGAGEAAGEGAESAAAAAAAKPPHAASTTKAAKQEAKHKARAEEKRRRDALRRARCIVDCFDGVKVFLLAGDFADVLKKKRYRNLFHHVHLGGYGAHFMNDKRLRDILRPEAVLSAELGRNMVPLKDFQKKEFEKQVDRYAGTLGAVRVGSNLDLTDDNYTVGSFIPSAKEKKAPPPEPEHAVYLWEAREADARCEAYAQKLARDEAARKAADEAARAAEDGEGAAETKAEEPGDASRGAGEGASAAQ